MTSRRILRLTGSDVTDFLQGLVTNDVDGLSDGLVYAAILTPQGKYLADFFLAREGDAVLLDVDDSLADMLVKRLTMYKLRADVTIADSGLNLQRGTGPAPDGALADPRHPALGWRSYIESAKNVFDFVITIFAFLASAYVYYPNEFSDSRLIRYIVMARVLRLVRIIISMKRFRLIGVIWYEIMPYATSVMCLLFFFMYAFAALGVELYGGMVTRDPSNPLSYLILNTDFSDNDYWANNFNDVVSAFNVLFNLLVVNNWTNCEIGFEAVTQHRLVRYYFFAFHFCGVILVNNLVVAFFINSFLEQGKILERRKDRVLVEGEAVIKGREALFDAAQVTGTRTSLAGGFIARIRTNHAEEDEQDRLRRLFTQTSDSSNIRYQESEDNEHVMPFAHF